MTELINKTTHAQRRRLEARKGARMKLQAGQYVRRLKEIADRVESVEPSQVPALRLKADIYCKLLAKCLPDLKAVEFNGNLIHKHVTEYSDDELAACLEEGSGEGTAPASSRSQ